MYVDIYSSSRTICQAMKREDEPQVIDPQEENDISFSWSEKAYMYIKNWLVFFSSEPDLDITTAANSVYDRHPFIQTVVKVVGIKCSMPQ